MVSLSIFCNHWGTENSYYRRPQNEATKKTILFLYRKTYFSLIESMTSSIFFFCSLLIDCLYKHDDTRLCISMRAQLPSIVRAELLFFIFLKIFFHPSWVKIDLFSTRLTWVIFYLFSIFLTLVIWSLCSNKKINFNLCMNEKYVCLDSFLCSALVYTRFGIVNIHLTRFSVV